MARVKWDITDVYQLVAAAPAVISFKKKGEGTLFINTTDADDETAEEFSSEENERQAEQQSTVNTYVRASGPGWVIVVDQ